MSIISNFTKGGSKVAPFNPNEISYTGEYTVEKTLIDGINYYLFIFTTSGIMTLNRDELICDICLCGGGSGGETPSMRDSGWGGNGGIVYSVYNKYFVKETQYTVVIGSGGSADAAGGNTSFGELVAEGGHKAEYYIDYASDAKYWGGSTGGVGGRNDMFNIAPSRGITTCPFNSTTMKPMGAGGGGGAYADHYLNLYSHGGKGGSDGSNGYSGVSVSNYSLLNGGAGGEKGGGTGGGISNGTVSNATNGTYWGAGGGGGAQIIDSSNTTSVISNAASGYQGVAMLRVLI